MNTAMHVALSVPINVASELQAAIETLASKELLVGVPAETADDRSDDSPINNAEIAYIQNYGSPKMGIPARPFLEPGVENAREDIERRLLATGRAVIDAPAGQSEHILDVGFQGAGLIAQNSVRAVINSDIPPPLNPGTLAARRRRGRTGKVALIDTGALRNSLTYVVRNRGAR